jgi:phosphate transport system substrate-binding protein
VLGAVVITYNLTSVAQPLRFSPDVVADIFLGKITKWDDARIKQDNPGVSLPAADITPSTVPRAAAPASCSPITWRKSARSGKRKWARTSRRSGRWARAAKGNEGVTGQIKNQPNTIGYVELAYAVQNKLPVALLKNASGKFVEPSSTQ